MQCSVCHTLADVMQFNLSIIYQTTLMDNVGYVGGLEHHQRGTHHCTGQ